MTPSLSLLQTSYINFVNFHHSIKRGSLAQNQIIPIYQLDFQESGSYQRLPFGRLERSIARIFLQVNQYLRGI